MNFEDKERIVQVSREKKQCVKISLTSDFSTIKKSTDNGTKFRRKKNRTQEYDIQPSYSCIKASGRHSETPKSFKNTHATFSKVLLDK